MTNAVPTARTEVEIRTEPLGGSPLARLVIAGEAPSSWLERCPTGADAWRERVDAVLASRTPDWAERLAPAFDARGAAAERLARSAGGRGIVVTTGQQPGLFGGPLYTWFKALSALALADALESATGIPVAPVFWAATDDADFAEAADTWVADAEGAHRLALDARETGGRPMSEVALGAIDAQLDALERACGSAAHGDVLDVVRRTHGPEATVGGAYVALLRALLEPLGIAVLDASHDAVRAAAAPLLRSALRDAPRIDAAVRDRTREIEAAGYAPQVPLVDGLSLVQGQDAAGAKARIPIAAAASVAGDAGARFGATVLLRPVMERAIVPTAAYVAGPGEIAYFAQVGAVADALGAARPLAVPRWSATLVEPRVRRAMTRLGVDVDAFEDAHAPERALAASLLPPAVVCALADLRADVARTAATLRESALAPDAVADGFVRQQEVRIDRLERRYRAAVRRREADRFRDLAAVRGALRPAGARQERALNLLPLLARHGAALLEDLRDAARSHAASLVGDVAAARRTTDRAAAAGT